MKKITLLFVTISISISLFAQDEVEMPKFYLGVSYGTSYSIGDFEDTEISNPDAGFAKDGQKFDLYGGFFLTNKITLTGTFRYQTFDTEIEDLIEAYKAENTGLDFTGSTENWETYYFLFGLAYRIQIGKKFDFFPRLGLGPLIANNPGISINAPNAMVSQNFNRSSETGIGLGYEIGIGLRTDLGKHFSLMPTFTIGGGVVRISDVVTTTDNIEIVSDYEPTIQSFNLGLSLAYRFY